MEQNENQSGGGAGQPGVDVPDEKRPRGPHPDSGKYVVLAADPPEGVQIEVDADGDPLDYAQLVALRPQMIWAGPAENGKEAKERALTEQPEWDAKTAPTGNGAWLVAVPLMNIKWRLSTSEQPPPVRKGL